MKKHGFGSRLLAMLLVLTMVLSYIPASVLAAVVGDTKSDKPDVGLVDNKLDTGNTIRWPIRIYDYLNDGMLFEYSYAGDYLITEVGGGAYGGGQAMPMIAGNGIVGEDYTSINGYYKATYDSDEGEYVIGSTKYAFRYWGSQSGYSVKLDTSAEGATEVTRSLAKAVKDVDPMRLHLAYTHDLNDDNTKSYGWVSNFAKDYDRYYTKDELRYMVMVYRSNDVYAANGGHNVKAHWSVSGSSYSSSYDISKGTTYVSANVMVKPSSEWTYVIVDMKSNTADSNGIAKNWDSIPTDQRICGVGMALPLAQLGEEMDISHIAYFSSEKLAAYFGEKCVAFDKDPGEYMGSKITMTHTVENGVGTPKVPNPGVGTYGWDFTESGNASWSKYPYSYWNDASGGSTTWMSTAKKTDSKGFYYSRVGSYDNDTPDYLPFFSSNSGVSKDSIDHIVLVYKTSGISGSPTTSFGITDGSAWAGWGSSASKYSLKVPATSSWSYVVYPLASIPSSSGITSITQIRWWLPGLTTTQYIDLAYVDYFADATSADNFGKAALNYLANYGDMIYSDGTSIKTTLSYTEPSGVGGSMWNMGSNQAFTMLYASKGGGWLENGSSSAGGTNDWTNGYYSYQLGVNWANPTGGTATGYRNSATSQTDLWGNSLQYRVPDDIYLLNTYGEDATYQLDMSTLDLGYTLYNTMKGQGVMTAGLLQSSQVRYEGTDGNEYTVMNYKEDTVHYIATLLRDTLVIPERDYYGYNYTFVKGTPSVLFAEDIDGDGRLDEVDEDLDGDGRLDVAEDRNGNGKLDDSEDLDGDGHLDVAEDRNGNGVLDYSEDIDGDGHLDVWEDLNWNGLIDPGEDKDGDGKLDVGEDVDYDGHLDVWEDKNNNGLLDPGEDLDGDGKLDVDEDVNGNGYLDGLNEDRNGNGELDEGEDVNGNGKLDWYNEDFNRNGKLDEGEDLNGNGKLDRLAEDFNGNGQLDLSEDADGDGHLDLADEDTNGNGKLDLGEDLDGDGHLDVAEDVDHDGHLDVDEDTFIDNGILDKQDLASALRQCLGIKFTDANLSASTAKEAQYQPNKAPLGSYQDTLTRNVKGNKNGLIGPYLKCAGNIKTFYDAAYYLLHNIFVPGSYNHPETDYQYLVMSKATVSGENKEAYVFDAGFTDANGNPGTVYDEEGKLIYQTSAADKYKICYQETSDGKGYWTTMKPFLPINDDGEVMGEEFSYSGTPYVRDDMSTSVNDHGATYALRNYNFAMTANGEFVYNKDKDLFFDFEGDDDVYMFINGELVLDIGAAHSITKVSFKMNNYVNAAKTVLSTISGYNDGMSDEAFIKLLSDKKGITATNGKTMTVSGKAYGYQDLLRLNRLNLVNGQSYTLDFYYMERHGWGANMRIATNIDMTNPKMRPGKTAYQGMDANGDLKELAPGAMIDDSKPVDYSFSLTNAPKITGDGDPNTKLYRLAFQDSNIGVDISYDNGLQYYGKPTVTTFYAESDTTVDVTGLNGIVELGGKRYRVTVDGNFIDQDKKITEYLTVKGSPNQYQMKVYQYNSTELYRDQNAIVKLGSATNVVAPKPSADGSYALTVDANNRIPVKGVRVSDANGGILEPRDLTITVDGYASQADYEAGKPIDTITIKVETQEQLMAFLKDLQDPNGQTVEGEGIPEGKEALYWGSGLWKNGTVTISGMWYTLTEEEQDAKIFKNQVRCTAYKSLNAPDPLVEYAEHHVYTPGAPMYYQWANHMVNLPVDRFWTDAYIASTDTENSLHGNVSLEALNDIFTDGDYSSAKFEIVNREGGQVKVSDNWYLDGKWATMPSEYTLGASADNHEIFYKQIHNWTKTYVYYWSDANSKMTTWPGIEMSELTTVKAGDGKKIFRAEIPADAQYVIFSNGTGNAVNAQTGNIALPAVEYDAVEWNETNDTLEVNYTTPGMHLFYVKVSSSKTTHTATIPVTFYATATKDKTYVLDFGLKTEDLNANGVLFRTDELLGAHASTAIKFMGITTKEPTYLGTWSEDAAGLNNVNRISFKPEDVEKDKDGNLYVQLEDGKVYMTTELLEEGSPIRYSNGRYIMDKRMWFVPEKIMDNEYDLWMGLTVHYKDAPYGNGLGHYNPLMGTNTSSTDKGYIDIGSEVQMFKKLTVLPATVVYYEDDFMDVHYEGTIIDQNDKTAGEFVHHGDGSGELTQGVDQNTPYGQDVTYQSSSNGSMSGQSMTTINIGDRNAKGSFGFAGTGFEIVSRTNSFDSASFVVEVFKAVEDIESGEYIKDGEPVKRLPVITEFTSTDVICKHDHHTPNGNCSYCGNRVSHSYENGKCTVCNAVEATYYLIGYINGSDQFETKEFEFVDGKLVATFDQDSWVMVMDSVGNQYWTDGDPGSATAANLFNVGKYPQMQGTKNKLHVPGGVEITLNLMDNGDGGLVLSYFREPVNLGERVLFFDTKYAGWDDVNIYYWSDSNSMMIDWPGVAMSQYEEEDENGEMKPVDGVFYYTVPSDATMVLFNNEAGDKTDDLTIPGDHFMCYYDSETGKLHWEQYGIEEEEEEVPTSNTIYFENSKGWENVHIYAWKDGAGEIAPWPGVPMEALVSGGSRYVYEVPLEYDKVIFNNGKQSDEPGADQTVNQPIYGDGYLYRDEKWYDPNGVEVQTGTKLIYFKNTYSGTPFAYVWDKSINKAPVVWPGSAMTHIPGTDYYYIRVTEGEVDSVIFHDGNGHQTDDLTINFTKPTFEDGKWIDYTPTASVRPIYFQNTENWSKVYAYFWSDAIGDMTEWPGVEMEQINGNIYMTEVPTDARYIKFTDGSVSKGDAGVPIGGGTFGKNDYFTGNKWVSYLDQNINVYFRNTEGWSNVYVYYWSDTNGSMVGWTDKQMTLVPGEDDLFVAKIPVDAQHLIFNNGGNGSGNQTGDLNVPDNDYVYNDGEWYPLGEEPAPVEVVYYLRGGMNNWDTSAPMTKQADGTYAVTIHLTAGTYEYKAAVEDWSWSCPGGNNATVTVGTECDVTFVLDLAANTVTASGDGIGTGGEGGDEEVVYYLRGTMNGWDTSTVMTKQADGTYAVTIHLDPGTYEYKAAKADWSWGCPSSNATVSVATACDVTFVLDVAANTVTATGDGLGTVEPPAPTGTITLYYDDTNSNWGTVYAYAWNGGSKNADWPGVVMTKVSGNIWKIEVADNMVNIIFNNGSDGTGNQTDDLTIPGDGQLFNGATWSIYLDAQSEAQQLNSDGGEEEQVTNRTLYFQNVYGWEAPVAYILYSDDTIGEVALDRVLGNYYLFSAPEDAKKVAFAEDTVTDPSVLLAQSGMALVEGKDCFGIDLSWSEYEVQEIPGYYTVYFDNATTNWSSVNAYAWGTAGELQGWPGVAMTHVSGDLWTIQIPVGMDNIVFNGDGAQTANLVIPGDCALYSGGQWSTNGTPVTQTVFFDSTNYGWTSVYAHYWKDVDGGTQGTQWAGVKMENIGGNIWKVEVPLGMTKIIFNNGVDGQSTTKQTGDLAIQGDGYIFATPTWKSMGGKIIFFANPEGWEQVFVTYGNGAEGTFISAPGKPMEDLHNGIWSAFIPEGNDTVNFYNGKYTPSDLPAQDNCYSGGKWYNYTGSDGKEIQQVPVIRVDGLDYDHYIVEISGMPQYTDDVDWAKIVDLQDKIAKGEAQQSELDDYLASVTKDTYLYIDGVRIFQPLTSKNDNYALKENSAAFTELRTLIMEGKAAVATYDVNTSVYSGNYSWTENRNGKFVGSQIKEIDDYLLIGPNNETYVNSNLNDQAVIFYVKEDHIEGVDHDRTLQIAMRALDPGLFSSGTSTGLYASVYLGQKIQQPDGSVQYGWKPLTSLLSGTEEYYEIDYKSCPYTRDANGDVVYQVVLSVRQGMVSFTSVKTNGLHLMEKMAEQCDYVLKDGIYQQMKVDEAVEGQGENALDFKAVALQMSSELYEAPVVEQPAPEVETMTDPGLELKYPSLSFEDEIFYNVYFTAEDISDVKEMGLMILPSKNDAATIEDAIGIVPGYITNGEMFMVKSDSIAAANMGDTVYFMVYACLADGTYAYSKAAGYSAKAYANTVLNGDYSAELKALAVGMVEYGAEAQLYFGHNTGALIDSALTDDQKAMTSAYDKTMMADPVKLDAAKTAGFVRNNANFKSLYPSVSFDGAFAINFYCVPAVSVDSDMTLYWWDAETAASVDQLTLENAVGSVKMDGWGQYWGQVDGIAAKDMDKTWYVTCVFESDGQIVTSGIIPYSLGAYCDSKAAVDGDAQQSFAQATAVYGYYAKDYFASIG